MICAPYAHIGGVPIEETLAALGPTLLVTVALTRGQLRARLRPVRARASRRAVRADRSDIASSDIERPSGRDGDRPAAKAVRPAVVCAGTAFSPAVPGTSERLDEPPLDDR